uniref:Cation-transporting P-type ATPase n=1 Tax=candidate division CPR3 bacterium TaxID=2268181 RepID=A0A7V3JA15_UNCC3
MIQENDRLASTGLRVLAFAYKDLGAKRQFQKEVIEQDLKFIGLVGIEDPPREGVKEAIALCKKAQIKVIMVTGDYGLTALAVAKQIGLYSKTTKVITGEEMHRMDDEKLKEFLTDGMIFARIDPSQKLRIVENLKEKGEVVAVTGDGVNDAPALVAADIGVAMGCIGTDVAKEVADMVLLDDHFATIVNAIKEGRTIFDNAKKIIFYVFSSNAGELLVPLFGLFLGLPLPLLPIQMLAIDLGTDVFPSLALGVEKEEPYIMARPPRAAAERMMNIGMLSRLFFVGLIMGTLAFLVYLVSLFEGGWHWGESLNLNAPLYLSATASVYTTLVLCQTANAFSCRSPKFSLSKIGIWTNPWLLYAELISFLMLFGVVYFPPLQKIFRTDAPSPLSWVLIILSFFIFLFLSEWRKRSFKNQAT